MAETRSQQEPSLLPITAIIPKKDQPRRYFDQDKLNQLATSIEKHGILEPLLVRPIENGYELIAGERRYRAAIQLNLSEVPVLIKELNDSEAQAIALIENLQREDLNPVEETEGILSLIGLELNLDNDSVIKLLYKLRNFLSSDNVITNQPLSPEILANDSIQTTESLSHNSSDNVITNSQTLDSKGFDKNEKTKELIATLQEIEKILKSIGFLNWESFIANRLPLLKLPVDILDALRTGQIEYTKALAISRLKNPEHRTFLLHLAISENLSIREIKKKIAELNEKPKPTKSVKGEIEETLKRVKKSQIWGDKTKEKKLSKLLIEIQNLLADDKI